MAAVVPPSGRRLSHKSRKRPHLEPFGFVHCKRDRFKMEETGSENGENLSNPEQMILKVLVPGYAAGAVIGKRGQIIVQLQKDSGATIKLSKAKDFYPGTQDRVVVIQGTADALLKVHCSIVEKVYDFPVPKDLAIMIGDRPKQVKIIVPNTTAGLVIGKSGVTVKTIMDETGAKIQLSQKPEGINVPERVITIKGDKRELMAASVHVIDKIKDDPLSSSCPNISYTTTGGPVANANPSGSPFAAGGPTIIGGNQPPLHPVTGPYILSNQHPILQAAHPAPHLVSHNPYSFVSLPAGDLSALNGGVSRLIGSPYGFYSPSVIPYGQTHFYSGTAPPSGVHPAALTRAVSTVPALSLVPTSSAGPNEVNPSHQTSPSLPISGSFITNLPPTRYVPAGHQILSVSHDNDSAITGIPNFQSAGNLNSSSLPQTSGSHSSQLVTVLSSDKWENGDREVIELAIPESLIGAVLGKAGRTLIECQEISGAKIQISKKGDYVVGTRNRRVTIVGKPPCPHTARALLTDKVASAHASRLQSKLI